MIELQSTQVSLPGLLSVLGEHLYSTPSVVVRELVQNAHDSCLRRRLEAPGSGGAARITTRAAAGVLTIEDEGAGLTHDEILGYLATVGSSYTRRLRDATGDTTLIGSFGLGFLAAFVVADKVTVHSASYQSPEAAWIYQSHDGQRFSVRPGEPRAVGTSVRLELKDRFRAIASEPALRVLLAHYCALLSVPIFVGADPAPQNAEVPWRSAPAGESAIARRSRRLAFAARFEREFEPLCTIDVSPTAESDVRGLLWIQSGGSYGTSDHRNVSVFVRGMLVDDDARKLLPRWAGFVGGVFESDALVPTVSRETLQSNDALHAAAARIERALVGGMSALARDQPDAWQRVVTRHNEALLGAALSHEPLFDLLADHLRVATTEGDLPARALRDRDAESRIYVGLDAQGDFEEMLCRALGVPLALGYRFAVLPFLARWCQQRGGTLVRLGTGEGDRQVFQRATLADADRRWLAGALALPDAGDVELCPARFSPPELPLVLVPNRDAELKARVESDETRKRLSGAALGLARLYTARITESARLRLFVNLESPVIQRLIAAPRPHRGADQAARMLGALALLQGRGAGTAESYRAALATASELLRTLIDLDHGAGSPNGGP
jgi:molecular chaperone HtpG